MLNPCVTGLRRFQGASCNSGSPRELDSCSDRDYWTAIPPTFEYADKDMLADGATFPVAVDENFNKIVRDTSPKT